MKQTSSIALITYNGERFLSRQLESIARQKRLPDKLIICDDGSVDKTVELAERFSECVSFPVQIIQNETNLGPGLNFRKALFSSDTDITFFCDQDDFWFDNKIEAAMSVFEQEPDVGMVLMNDKLVNEKEELLIYHNKKQYLTKPLQQNNSFATLLKGRCFGWAAHNLACRTAYRNILFTNAPPAAEIFDQWVFRCMGALSEVRTIVEPTMFFRRHGNNFTSHSKKTKNPLVLLYNSFKRHFQIDRITAQADRYRQVAEYLKNLESIQHPNISAFYYRCWQHQQNRIKAITCPIQRPLIIAREYCVGNYSVCSGGLTAAIADMLAIPQYN